MKREIENTFMKDKPRRKSAVKLFCSLFLALSVFGLSAQDIPVFGWRSHFSYHRITHVQASSDAVYAATDAAAYFIDKEDQSINNLNKNTGLNDIGISAMSIAEAKNRLLIGYENGNIDLIDNGTIININDILNADNLRDKTINSARFENEQLWIGANFGMALYAIDSKVIIEAYQNIGQNGDRVAINEFIISQDSIYAASSDGLISVSLDDQTNRQDFNFWQRQLTGIAFEQIIQTELGLMASSGSDLFQQIAGQWQFFLNTIDPIEELFIHDDQLYILTEQQLLRLENDILNPLLTAENGQLFTSLFIDNDQTYIGTSENGLLSYANLNSDPQMILPPGPSSDQNILNIDSAAHLFWLSDNSISLFSPSQNQWENQLVKLNNGSPVNDLNDFEVNTQHQVVSSYPGGLFVKDSEIFTPINEFSPNNTLNTLNNNYRLSGLAAGSSQNLWIVQNGISPALTLWEQELDNWTGFSLDHPQSDYLTDLFILENEDKWMPVEDARGGGVLVFNEESNRERYLNINGGQGGLPGSLVTDIVQDQDRFIWVATDEGICFFPNPEQILSNNSLTANIPIFDGGLLLRDEHITSIAIDPANRKWFGTLDDGIWLFSETGESLIQRFTSENSPLASDEIIDISIDSTSGEVFITTSAGISSFRSDATEGGPTHGNVKIYPNPVSPNFNGLVVLEALVNNARLKITDASGKLVRTLRSNGSTATWNVRNEQGARVSAGVYLVFSSNRDGSETYIGKIVII